MDLTGLPDETSVATGLDLSTLPDTNAAVLRKKYSATVLAPETAAKIVDISKRTGLPEKVVERNQQTAERRANEPDWNAFELQAPRTAELLASDDNLFKLAYDDTSNLRGIERTLGELGRQFAGPVRALSAGLVADFNAAVYGLAEPTARMFGADSLARYSQRQRKYLEDLGQRIQGDYGQGDSFMETGIASGTRSFGAMLPATVASVLTGSPQFLLSYGSALAGGQAAGKGMDAGLAPWQALAYGVEDAAAEYVTEMIPVANLFKHLGAGTPFYKLLADQIIREVPTELAATAWQNFNEWLNVNPERSFKDYITQLGPDEALTVVSTVVQTTLSAGLASGANKAALAFARRQDQARAAAEGGDALARLSQLASAAKLRTLSPDAFKAFVESTGATDLYLDANVFMQAGIDPAVLEQLAPSLTDQIKTAQESGGDIVIPVSEYATRLVGTELDSLLMPHLRTSEDAISSAEAQHFFQAQAEEFQQAAAGITEEMAVDEVWNTAAKAVEEKIFSQLRQAGRFTGEVNDAYAKTMRAFYETNAVALGITPKEMFNRYPLLVQAEPLTGGKVLDRGFVNQLAQKVRGFFTGGKTMEYGQRKPIPAEKLAEWEGFKTGQPGIDMSQFFQAAAFHGSPHKFDKFSTEKIGTGEGEQAYGHGLYFAGAKEVAEWYRKSLTPRYRSDLILVDEVKLSALTELGRNVSAIARVKAITALDNTSNLDIDEAVSNLQSDATLAGKEKLVEQGISFLEELRGKKLSRVEKNQGHLYEVELAPAEDEYLLWDKPLSEQSEKVQKAFTDDMRERFDISDPQEREVGATVYHRIAWQLGQEAVANNEKLDDFRGASEFLHSLGIRGIKYLDGTSRGKGDGNFNYVIFSDDDVAIKAMFQTNRGQIAFGDDITQQPTILTLLKNADLTTFLHEMGHFQLEVLSDIAARPAAPPEIVADMEKVLGWFGIAPAEGMTVLGTWRAMSLEAKRPYHEQFARGFEAYLFEGKAPSTELNSLFARFRSWLLRVYKALASLNVEINDELRGVFDRMLATDEAIKEAENTRAFGALFASAEEMGADQAGWEDYQRLAVEATEASATVLQARSLRDMKWGTRARSRTIKLLQKDAKAKREAVLAEVTAEVREMPVYAAQRFMRHGEIDGEKVTGAKLDLPMLKATYGEDANALWRFLPTGQYGLVAAEGLTPDQVAEMFGFTSGDELIREILAQPPEAQMIEGLTDQRVLERYGDISSPDALNQAADEAVHNDLRIRFVATELKALDKASTPTRVIMQAAKQYAEKLLARKKVKDIKPRATAAAETRAAKAAMQALAEGDRLAAAVQKRNQIVHGYSTKLSYEAQQEVTQTVKYLHKFDKEGSRKSLDPDYLDQIDQLLDRFDLRASVSNKAAKKRTSLLAWVESQRDQGFEPDIPLELLEEAARKPYKELTLEELRGLRDTVKQIEHLGRLKRKLLTAKDAREFALIRDEIAASIEANAQTTRDLRTRANAGGAAKELAFNFLAMHRKMASMARELDGFVDGGPLWEYLIRPMNEAGDNETTMNAEATQKLYELVKPLLASGGRMGGKGIYFPTLGGSYNREERIGIALNMGNAGNLQRLLDGEGWALAQLQPLLDTITSEEAAFVQSVWDFFESYRPKVAEQERRIYGKEPKWLEPVPLTLGGVQLRGGYYPVRYDPKRSGWAAQHHEAEEAKRQMHGAYISSTPRKSFTKARADEVVGRPLLYSFSGIYQGATEVIHALAWQDWLIDANKLVRSLDGVIRAHYGDEGVNVFKTAIRDIAAGVLPAQNIFERGLNHLRVGATIAGLGWNTMTALLQPLGLTQSMARIGSGWVGRGVLRWLKSPTGVMAEITGKSVMMQFRAKTIMREINEIQNLVRDSKLDPVRSTFFTLIQKLQLIADVPTWLGGYEKAIAEGNDEARAVALADQAVLDSQGGGQIKDLSQIQRGHPALKLFTNFYSFFNVAQNLGAEKTKQKLRSPKLYPSLALDYLLLYILPAGLSLLMREALVGDLDDDEELLKKMINEQISYLFGLFIGLREVSAAAQKIAGVEQFKGAYGGPAGLRFFQEIDKLGQQIGQGEVDKALLKSANNVAGVLFHYPSGQINRTADGIVALVDGKTENPVVVLTGPRR